MKNCEHCEAKINKKREKSESVKARASRELSIQLEDNE